MLRFILTGGLLMGFAAGLLAAALHLLLVQPVLLEAERYERGEVVHHPAGAEGHDHESGPVLGQETASVPSDGAASPASLQQHWGRNGLTALFFGLTYAGFGLVTAALMALAAERGHASTLRTGLAWGVAGWITVQLAPALGLPPELPGMAGAELSARQGWWALTVATTALGLAALALGRGWPALALGVALLASPHVMGAPQPVAFSGPAPPELAALFAVRTLGTALVAWLALGWSLGALWDGKVFVGRPRVA